MPSIQDLRASDALWNPYDFANPVGDDALFAGRGQELADIRYYLRLAGKAPRPINLVLTGPRSAGKTSLLNRIEHESLARGFCVARVDLNEGDTSPLNLFYKVYDSILTAAVADGTFGGLNGDAYRHYRLSIDGSPDPAPSPSGLQFPRHFAAASVGTRVLSEAILKADLQIISRELGTPCVLLFDECDVLAKSRIELEMIRNVFMNTAGYMLAMAGTPNLFSVLEDVFSPIIRQFKKIPVERFARDEDTAACMEKPLRSLGLSPQEVFESPQSHLYREVHRLSAGRPYEVQLLCHYMFRRIEDGRSRRMAITLDVLDDVRRELETQEGDASRPIVNALRLLSAPELKVLNTLTACRGTFDQLVTHAGLFRDKSADRDALGAAARRFVAMGILVEDGGVLHFAGDQFDEVYGRYLAASKQALFYPSLQDFRSALAEALVGSLWFSPNVSTIREEEGTLGGVKTRLEEAIAALISPASSASALPDATDPLYGPAIRSMEEGELVLAEVCLSILGTSTSLWSIIPPSEESAFLSLGSLLELTSRAQLAGGELTVDLFRLTLPDRGTFLGRVMELASPSQLEDFAEHHLRYAVDLHDAGDYTAAAVQASTAFEMAQEPNHANVAAHTHLLAGKPAIAETFAIRSREAALQPGQEDLMEYGCATYDLAIARAIQGDRASATALLAEAIDVASHLKYDGCHLAILSQQGGASLELLTDTSLGSCSRTMLDLLDLDDCA